MIRLFHFDKYQEKRGCAYTFFDQREMPEMSFVQDKVSVSNHGVVRGFHGDNKTWKLITCLYGSFRLVTYDVDNNLRQEVVLKSEDERQTCVLVPPRHLNGHQCLTGKCIFLYKWSDYYEGPDAQWSVNYNDKTIDPQWNYVSELSERDLNAGTLKELKDSLK